MVSLEYIAFEHNNAAAELVKLAYDTPPLAFVHSYGCQQNVNDGERIKGVLMDIGYGLCDKPEDADLILFNTCAVREHAEQRVFGNVGALKGLKEKKHGLIIGLCGCMANQKHVVEKLRQSYPYVDLVFGVDGIDTLPQLIAQKLQKHKRVLMEPAQRPVIVEGYGRNEGTLSGRLDNNLTVEFEADSALMGSYAMVRLTGARATVLLGELSE